MARQSMQTQIGAEMQDGTQTFVAGQKRGVTVQPIDRDKDRRLSTTVFSNSMQEQPYGGNGDMQIYRFDVPGGLCGVESLFYYGSGNGGTAVSGQGKSEYNAVVGCTHVHISTMATESTGVDGATYCLTGDASLGPERIGKIIIKNLGSPLPTYGYTDPARTIQSDHRGVPWPMNSGDMLYWGIGTQSRQTDEEQVEEGGTGGNSDPHVDMLCSCEGIPGWYANMPDSDGKPIDPDWVPCASGGYNDNPVATGIPDWVIRDRNYFCTDVVWKGRIPPSGRVEYDVPQGSETSVSATGVVLKFIAGPGKYAKEANMGKKIGPIPGAKLYRDVWKPIVDVKIEVYPAPK